MNALLNNLTALIVPESFESTAHRSLMGIAERFFFSTAEARVGVYPFALVLVLVALLAHLAISPASAGLQYLVFFPVVVLAAIAGGFRLGMFTTAIGLVYVASVLATQRNSFSIEGLFSWPNMVFLATGVILSVSMEAMHLYRRDFDRKLKKTQEMNSALVERKIMYQNLMENSLDGIHIMDIDGNLLEANDAFCRMLGYTQDEVMRLNVTDWDAKWTREELRSAFRDNVGKSMLIETLHRHKDGVLLDVEISVSNIKVNDSYYIFASSRDVTERNKLNLELVRTTEHLRELVTRYESSQEAERKAIAREVHDELGQILSTLRLDISMVRTRFGKHHSGLMEAMLNMTGLVDRAIHGVRNVSENLRPAVLGIGIVVSIKWLCDNFAAHSGISCTLDSPDPNLELDEARAIVVFRIVQESMTNIQRHAQAKNIKVAILTKSGNLCVEIQDDGTGFDMAEQKRKVTHGLFGMRERALACGGHLDIVSNPGKGTTIFLCIPFKDGK